jgi:hypothetical protein
MYSSAVSRSVPIFFFRATAEEYEGGGRRLQSHSTILERVLLAQAQAIALGGGRRGSDDDHCSPKVVGVELEDFEARRVDESAHVPVPPTTPLFSVLRGLEK